MRAIVHISALICSLVALSCDATSPKYSGGEGAISIAHLKSLYNYKDAKIDSNITISGRVTSSDHLGECYKSITIEDSSAGITTYIDLVDIHKEFPLGSLVGINCNSLSLEEYGGNIRLGYRYEDGTIGRIPNELLHRHIRLIDTTIEFKEPAPYTIPEISLECIDRLIVLENVRFTEADGEELWCEYDSANNEFISTERTLIDNNNNRLTIRVLGSSNYASSRLPDHTISISGMVEYFNEKFTFRAVNYNEI